VGFNRNVRSVMRYATIYRCPLCRSTKELIHDSEVCSAIHVFPETVYCGWRGCSGMAKRQTDVVGGITIHRDVSMPIGTYAIIMEIATQPERRNWFERAHKIIFKADN
jgi:hypothetical protein